MESSENPLNELPAFASDIRADTEAEAMTHVMASALFLQHLCGHKRIRDLFKAWMFATGLHGPVGELRAATEEVKALKKGNAPRNKIKAAEQKRKLLQGKLRQEMQNIDPRHPLVLAEHYLSKEFHLSWHWLIEGLGHAWQAYLWGRANMESQRAEYGLQVNEPSAPSMEHFRFVDIPDEKASNRFERFRQETKLFLKEQEAEYKSRRLRKGKASAYGNVERYVDWYFRNKIEGVSSEDIAKADSYDDSHVRERIRAVQIWLDRVQ